MTRLTLDRRRWTPWPLVAALIAGVYLLSFAPGEAQASTAPPCPARTATFAEVETALHRRAVTRALRDLGYSPQEIDARLSKLSDHDLEEVARHARALRPGGDAADAFIGLLVFLVLVAFLVWLILYLTDHSVEVRTRRRILPSHAGLDRLM